MWIGQVIILKCLQTTIPTTCNCWSLWWKNYFNNWTKILQYENAVIFLMQHTYGSTAKRRLIDYYICGRASVELMVAQHFPTPECTISFSFFSPHAKCWNHGSCLHASTALSKFKWENAPKAREVVGVLRFQPAALVSFDSLVARRVKNPATFMVVHFSGSTYLFS